MKRSEVLNTAESIVNGARNDNYGAPEDNFLTIARFWSVYLGIDINATNVSVMMALLKIARIKSCPNEPDSWVDLAGYSACGCEIATRFTPIEG